MKKKGIFVVIITFLVNFGCVASNLQHFNQSSRYLKDSNYTSALMEINTYIEKEPVDDSGYFLRSHIFHKMKKYENEITDLTKAISLSKVTKDKAQYYKSKATAYYLLEDHDKAISNMKESIKLNQNDPNPYLLIIKIHIAQGNKAEAEKVIKQVEPLVVHDAQLSAGLKLFKEKVKDMQ